MLGGAAQEGVASARVLGGGVRRRLVVAQPLAEALVVEQQLLVLPRCRSTSSRSVDAATAAPRPGVASRRCVQSASC